MRNPETMLRIYEELADRFARGKEARFRDQCLVLAADAALAANQQPEADRLRQRLLQVNPHHLLRPFASMAEAVQAPDVEEYIADLRRQWPPEFAEKLYLSDPEQAGPAAAPAVTPAPVRSEAAPQDVVARPLPPKESAKEPAKELEASPIPLDPRPAPPVRRAAVAAKPSPQPVRAAAAVPAAPAAGAAPARPARTEPPVNVSAPPAVIAPSGRWMVSLLLLLGIAVGIGLFLVAFVWPLLN
jgi:hypothetical protein